MPPEAGAARTVRSGEAGAPAPIPAPIPALNRPSAYAHAVGPIRRRETHISWVFLTGKYAYKIKKPVKFGFLDFSTLDLRRAACEEEIRLNRRLTADLYLDVVPITGTPADPRVDGAGTPFEYAVRMREFPQADQLDRRLAAGPLPDGALEQFAQRLADFHRLAPRVEANDPFGQPDRIRASVQDSLAELEARPRSDFERWALVSLRHWCEARFRSLEPVLDARRREGWIREGHGDLHLANLVWRNGAVEAFDCIEFNPAFRWIDVVSDVAFLVMDLAYRGHPDLSYRFLDRWLGASGDYEGLRVLRYYLVYRALVRAKVAAIRRDSPSGSGADARSVRAHLELAQDWTRPEPPMLILMHGVSGSGKSRMSDALLSRLPAIRVRSDLERKRLHGLAGDARSDSAIGSGLYSADASERTYARLAQCAEAALAGSESVIVDAAFLRRDPRARLRQMAQRLRAPLCIVQCTASPGELRRRVELRAADGADASEAGPAVLEHQLASAEPLDPAERAVAIRVDTTASVDADAVAQDVRATAALDRD